MNWTETLENAFTEFPKPELPTEIKLPMIPHAITQFSQKADDPDVSIKELAQVIEIDSGLSCELLKYVNSAAIATRNPITNAQQAISLLGIRPSKLFLLTRGLRASLTSRDSKHLNFSEFWNTNLERAIFAKEIARLLRADRDIAYSAAMLQDLLLPVFTDSFAEQYDSIIERQSIGSLSLAEAEREEFGWDHAIAAAYTMKDWNFPDDLTCCALFHHGGLELLSHPELGKTAVAAVAVSSLLPDQLNQTPEGYSKLVEAEKLIPRFYLRSVAETVDQYFEESATKVENRIPLLERLQEAEVFI